MEMCSLPTVLHTFPRARSSALRTPLTETDRSGSMNFRLNFLEPAPHAKAVLFSFRRRKFGRQRQALCQRLLIFGEFWPSLHFSRMTFGAGFLAHRMHLL